VRQSNLNSPLEKRALKSPEVITHDKAGLAAVIILQRLGPKAATL
jgi:hypothetical protein